MSIMCVSTEIANPIIILLKPPDGEHDRIQQDYEIDASYYIRNSLTTIATIGFTAWNIVYSVKVVKAMKKVK